MKEMFKIILAVSFAILQVNADNKSLKLLGEIEKELSCTEQFNKDEDNTKLEECIKKILEININETNRYKVQLGVFSKKEGAIEIRSEYNKLRKKIPSLRNSKVDDILKEFKGHQKKYIVFVFQKGVNAKKLLKIIQRNDKEKKFKKAFIIKPKIVIDINNKIIKNNPDDRVKILKAKTDCYNEYKKNKLSGEFEECLNEETINAIQIHALPNKEFCEKAKNKCDKGRKCQCIEKKVKSDTYYTIVETIESSKKDVIKKIKQKKSKPFSLKKPEILIK